MKFATVTCLVLLYCASANAKSIPEMPSSSSADLIELTIVSADFPFELNGSVQVIGIKSPKLLELPLMPYDLDTWPNIKFSTGATNSTHSPHWNVTFHLSAGFFTEETYLAFQYYDRMFRYEPDVYISGTMLTIGQLEQMGTNSATLQLKYSGRSTGTAVVSWRRE